MGKKQVFYKIFIHKALFLYKGRLTVCPRARLLHAVCQCIITVCIVGIRVSR